MVLNDNLSVMVNGDYLLFISKNHKILLIIGLLSAACFLTYYFRTVLDSGTVFTHFFYIPIILACVWWKKKGLIVTLVLIVILLLSNYLIKGYAVAIKDYFRALMLLLISVITVGLSERLSFVKEELLESEEKYRKIFETTGTAMTIIDDDTTISLANHEFEKLSGFYREEVEGRKSWKEFIPESDLARLETYHNRRREDEAGAPKTYETDFVNRMGEMRKIFATVDMIPGTGKSVASLLDITEFKQATETQKMLQKELSDTLTKVLSGFIPICASCKKIRDEKNDWIQIELYIRDRTDATFSHGICPECSRTLYADIPLRGSVKNGK